MLVNPSTVPMTVSPGDASAWRVSLDDGPPKDLYALWNSVFEAAHADSNSTAAQRSRTQPPVRAQAQTLAGAVATTNNDLLMTVESHATVGSHAATRSLAASDSELARSDPVRPDAPVAGALETGAPETRTASQAAKALPLTPTPFEMTHTPPNGSPQPEPSEASAPRSHCCAPSVATFDTQLLESAHVFVKGHDHLVEIAVRAATLSDQEALDCAFATARELTGQRTTLQRLTVNGRTVYHHADQDVPTPGSSSYYEV